MKAVILAAGMGLRIGKPVPKALLELPSGESILSRQVRIFKSEGIEDISVVVGYKKELIMSHIPDVRFIFNPEYRNTNTAKSLLCALEGVEDDIIWANGDLVYDENILTLLKSQRFNTIVVNNAKCGEEEVKYLVDKSGNVISISKEIENGQGEALGINLIKKKSIKVFIKALNECKDTDFFEKAIQILIDRGVIFKHLDVSDYRCIEIDFEEDLNRALILFGQNGRN
ncbi:MAG: UDP-N-acetylglucosamine pyrophosphorylase [candidate division Zixibacteria bacterium 4484_95]|nr:MAG: UDP-N-acetylglucosamine pyrophosphorylase [candidate division Zixibacteria bacterium 4484_95]